MVNKETFTVVTKTTADLMVRTRVLRRLPVHACLYYYTFSRSTHILSVTSAARTAFSHKFPSPHFSNWHQWCYMSNRWTEALGGYGQFSQQFSCATVHGGPPYTLWFWNRTPCACLFYRGTDIHRCRAWSFGTEMKLCTNSGGLYSFKQMQKIAQHNMAGHIFTVTKLITGQTMTARHVTFERKKFDLRAS